MKQWVVLTDDSPCYNFILVTLLRTLSRSTLLQSHFWGTHVWINSTSQRCHKIPAQWWELGSSRNCHRAVCAKLAFYAVCQSREFIFMLTPAAWQAEWSSMCFGRVRNIPKLYAKWPVRGLQNSLSETLIATYVLPSLHQSSCLWCHVGKSGTCRCVTYSLFFLGSWLFALNLSVILRFHFKRVKGSITQVSRWGLYYFSKGRWWETRR